MLDVCGGFDIMSLVEANTADRSPSNLIPPARAPTPSNTNASHLNTFAPTNRGAKRSPHRFRQPSLEVAMALYDVHVTHQNGAGWTVKQRSGEVSFNKSYGFRIREHAEAFGRALAHRNKVALVVHHPDGREARYAESALSYPAQLS
jgi:hypothetical protein